MIKTELLENDLIRTYSDAGMKIHGGFPEGDYNEAIDPVSAQRTYTETDIPIEDDELTDSEALYIITDGEHGKDGDEHEVE
jgi:hypothetical protein